MAEMEDASKYIQRKRKEDFYFVTFHSQNQYVVALKETAGTRLCSTNLCQWYKEYESEDAKPLWYYAIYISYMFTVVSEELAASSSVSFKSFLWLFELWGWKQGVIIHETTLHRFSSWRCTAAFRRMDRGPQSVHWPIDTTFWFTS
jgi:hypothetical protein